MVSVAEARRILRRNQWEATERHSRVHIEAITGNTYRIRALEGICGNCSCLELQIMTKRGKSLVEIRCSAGFSPLSLYQKTALGETPECPRFSSNNPY